MKLAKESLSGSTLKFPGKISIHESTGQLAIADTGNHRILVSALSGVVEHCIGSGQAGHKDGSFGEAMFFAPQGVCWFEEELYVADTENHRIRKVSY